MSRSKIPSPADTIRLVTDAVPLLLTYINTERRYLFNNRAYADWFGLAPDSLLGRPVWDVIGAAAYEVIRPHIDAALAGRHVTYETAMPYAQGGPRHVFTELIPDAGPDGVVRGLTAYVRDITQRRQVEDKMETLARRQAVLLAAQAEIAEAGGDLEAILSSIARRARQITGAVGAVVALLDGTGPSTELVYRAVSGTEEGFLGLRLPLQGSYSGRCAREGRVLHCADVEAEPGLDQVLLRSLQIRSMIAVPLQHMGQTVGVLKVSSPHPHAFDDDAVTLLQLMVSMIVAAMSGVAEAEARRALSAGRKEAAERQRRFLRDVLLSVTDGCLHLCDEPGDLPPALPPFGPPLALTEGDSLADLRRRTREAAGAAALPSDRTHDLLTAVGEASMNVLTHAGAGTARVGMGGGVVQVWIEDKGEGITVENLPKATLARGFSTKATLGHGFKMMLQTVDRIFLLTGSGGTTVVLEQEREGAARGW